MIELIKKIAKEPRPAGSKQCQKVRDILIKKLQELGYKTKVQEVPFTGWKLIEKPKLKINNKNVKVLPVLWSGSGEIEGTLKKANKIKTFEAYEWIRYKVVDDGKTKGYIVSRPDHVWLQSIDNKSELPYFMIYPETYEKIKDKDEVKVEASVKSRFLKNQNIYNIVTKNNSEEKIVICAHYDCMPNTVGANDNASGVSTLMEIARQNENVQFILFSAEEYNKSGSYFYVNSLEEEELNKIKLLINIDMVGHGTPYCLCSDKLKNSVKEILPEGTKIGKPRPPFDLWPFYKKGINVLHFGAAPYKYCHFPEDTIDKLEEKPMKQIVQYVNKIIEKYSFQLDNPSTTK